MTSTPPPSPLSEYEVPEGPPEFIDPPFHGSMASRIPPSPERPSKSFPTSSSSQDASYKTGQEMTSLARSSDGKYVVLAGEKIFKTIKIDGCNITEKDDLRAAITSHASSRGDMSSGNLQQQLDIKDVQWSHSELSSTIITTSVNGKITLYDLNRVGSSVGLEVSRIQGHIRPIHKVSVNPHKGNWLLSASQDGTVKLYDLRVHPSAQGNAVFTATSMYKCNAEAIRDVKWSPKDGMEFACASDAGIVQKWDMRQNTSPLLKINAHSKPCRTIAYHPDGNNLMSGGLDQMCFVWDVSKTADRRQRPKYTIQTPAPISMVRWRPPKWSTRFEKFRAAQVAIVYDDSNPAEMQESTVQIYDIARPAMPFKEVFDFDTSPTGLIWQGPDLLWTVGKYGYFTQTDIAFTSKTVDNRSLSAIAFSSRGELFGAMEKRIPTTRRKPMPTTPSPGPSNNNNTGIQASSSSAAHPGALRVDVDDDIVGNFLNIMPRRRRRTGAEQPNPATTQAPPTLEESLALTGEYEVNQLLFYGKAPGTGDRWRWEFLCNVYIGCVYEEQKDAKNKDPEFLAEWPWMKRFNHIMENFAIANEKVGWHERGQSWRVMAFQLGTTLERRAVFHRDQRVTRHNELLEQQEKERKMAAKQEKEARAYESQIIAQNISSQDLHTAAKSIISEEIESTSNVPTPLARPISGPPIQEDILELSPPTSSPSPELTKGEEEPCTEGYDFYDAASIVPAIKIATPQRRLPLRLDYPEESSSGQALRRHDSSESFEMFSTSEDSKGVLQTPIDSSWESTPSFDKGKGRVEESTHLPKLVIQPASLDISTAGEPFLPPHADEAVSNDAEFIQAIDPHEILDSDYYPQPDDPDFIVAPLVPERNIARVLEYELERSPLVPFALALFVKPLIKPGVIDDNQAQQIMLHVHQRLNSMELFATAALLRKACYPEYPAVYEQGRWGTEMGFKCSKCGSALKPDPNNPAAMTYCNTCKAPMDGCSLCQQFELPDTVDGYENACFPTDPKKPDEPKVPIFNPKAPGAARWVWCQGCEHGGHAACLAAWHALDGALYSGGQCPVLGCGHACIPGKLQEDLITEADARAKAELEKQVRENTTRGGARGVRRDSEEVAPSNAVENVRAALENL